MNQFHQTLNSGHMQKVIVADSSQEWELNIVQSALKEIEKQRCVLIICETIANAQIITERLANQYTQGNYKGKINLYTSDNTQSVEKKLDLEDVIVATNLLGCETNIEVSETVESNGGLHVIVTFLPQNVRVKDQAFGHSAKQGSQGTSQLILNGEILNQQLYNNDVKDYKYFRQLRDQQESNKLSSFQENELETIYQREKVSNRFFELLKLKMRLRKFEDELQAIDEKFIELFHLKYRLLDLLFKYKQNNYYDLDTELTIFNSIRTHNSLKEEINNLMQQMSSHQKEIEEQQKEVQDIQINKARSTDLDNLIIEFSPEELQY